MILSEKVKSFCKEYVVDFNGAAAARRVGYSKRRAKVRASELLSDTVVQKYLHEIISKRDNTVAITADRVLREISRIAFADPSGYFTLDSSGKPKMKELHDLTADQRAAVAEFDIVTKKLKLYDKLNALEKLGKHLKLFTELHENLHTFTIMPELKLGGKPIIFNVGEPRKK